MHESIGQLRTYLRERVWGNTSLSDRERSLSLYLLTGEQTTESGLFCLSSFRAGQVLGVAPAEVEDVLARTVKLQGWAYDDDARVIWIKDWFAGFVPEDRRDFAAMMEQVRRLPESPLVGAWANQTEHLPEGLLEAFQFGVSAVLLPEGVVGCDVPAKPIVTPTAFTDWKFLVKGGKHWTLEQRRYDDYQKTYGRKLDLDDELAKARTWLRNNQPKRTTPQGMPRFLTGWMNRASSRSSGMEVSRRIDERRADPRGNAAALQNFLDMFGG